MTVVIGYAILSGPGPVHVVVEVADKLTTLCGRRRVNRKDVQAANRWPPKRTCEVCARARRVEADSAATLLANEQMTALGDEVARAITELRSARSRLADLLPRAFSLRHPDVDKLLRVAHEAGYTYDELGQFVGRTRELVRQRVARVPDE